MFCPRCGAEYTQGVRECHDCGIPLVLAISEERRRENATFVRVLTTEDLGDIAYIKSLLDASGIVYYFTGDESLSVPAELMVFEEHAGEAREILKGPKLADSTALIGEPGGEEQGRACAAVTVRDELPGDAGTIWHINEKAFGQSGEADLVDLLRSRGKLIASLVAEEEGRIVGHIAFSRVSLDGGGRELSGAGLAPMAVMPEMQKRGIGSALVAEGLEKCGAKGIDYVVVLGHPDYYPRFGFVPAGQYGLRCEFDAPEEAFMVIELRAGSLLDVSGTVRFESEFSGV